MGNRRACCRGGGGGHKAKAERERGKEGESESQSVSDQMTLMALDCGAGVGGGCMEVDGNSVSGGRWSQLIGRDGRRGKAPHAMAMMLM